MANQKTRKAGKGNVQTATRRRAGGSAKRAQAGGYAVPPAGTLTQTENPGPIDNSLGAEGITWGSVDTYSVDADRMMIKLNAGAINHPLVSVAADAPYFRSAVSMAMMAHHMGRKLTIRYWKPDRRYPTGDQEVLFAREVAIGNEPGEALAFEDWPIDYPG